MSWLHSIAVVLGLALVAGAGPATQPAPSDPVAAARRWCEALVAGRVADALANSELPFAFDGKEVINQVDQLRARYEQIAKKTQGKGLAVTSADKIEGAAADQALKDVNLPEKDKLVVIRLMLGKDAMAVYVRPGAQPKVAGFRD